MTPRDSFLNKDFSFIASFEVPNPLMNDYLTNYLTTYNQHYEGLLKNTITPYSNNKLSKTMAIVNIYKFFHFHYYNLINIQKKSHEQMLLAKESENFEYFQRIKLQSQRQLKSARKFLRWAESIISKSSLKRKSNLLAKNEKNPIMAYDDTTADNTPVSDMERVNSRKGIKLPPRLKRESLDPLHRPWGTMFGNVGKAIREKLEPVFNNWSHNKSKEDLTVEIEFDDSKKEQAAIYIKYFTEEEALSHLMTTNNEKKLTYNNHPAITTTENYIFVMDKSGNLFIHKDNQYIDSNGNYYASNENFNPELKRVTHSSFTRGKSVACAGEIMIRDGKVTLINNNSGHYQPGVYSLYRVVSELNRRGVLDEHCKIQVFKNELTVEAFEKAFSHVKGNLTHSMKLTETSNPKNLLDCLTNINLYLKKRANDTSPFRSIFGSYNGADYFERRDSFRCILSALKFGSIDTCLILIDNHINLFDKSSISICRNYYATHLKELKSILESYKSKYDNVLQFDYVHKKISSYHLLYENMSEHTKKLQNYKKKFQLFSSNADTLNEVISPKVDYRYNRKDLDKKTKNEFLTDQEFHDSEFKNLTWF